MQAVTWFRKEGLTEYIRWSNILQIVLGFGPLYSISLFPIHNLVVYLKGNTNLHFFLNSQNCHGWDFIQFLSPMSVLCLQRITYQSLISFLEKRKGLYINYVILFFFVFWKDLPSYFHHCHTLPLPPSAKTVIVSYTPPPLVYVKLL